MSEYEALFMQRHSPIFRHENERRFKLYDELIRFILGDACRVLEVQLQDEVSRVDVGVVAKGIQLLLQVVS
jgi:hypothetical protein